MNEQGVDVHVKPFGLEGLGVILSDDQLVKVVEDCHEACVLGIVEDLSPEEDHPHPNGDRCEDVTNRLLLNRHVAAHT